MSDFIVTIDDEKFSINTNTSDNVIFNDVKSKIKISQLSHHTYTIKLENNIYHVTTSKLESNKYSFLIDGHYFEAFVRTKLEEEAENILSAKFMQNGEINVSSPMPGLILKINKNIGDKVKKGESLILLEAMKMENEIKSPVDGTIMQILIEVGKSVEKNQKMLIIN